MKIKNMDKYEIKYKEALTWMKGLYSGLHGATKEEAEKYFPELKENDESIRKDIISFLKDFKKDHYRSVNFDSWIAWLEKQGEQPTDKVETKFKVGDWVVSNNNGEVWQIGARYTEEGQRIYLYNVNDVMMSITLDELNNDYHLWTIHDAKDGNVLAYVTDEEDLWIMIYQSLYEPYEGHVHYHALLVNDNFVDKGTCCICIDDLKPATKKQRDMLFQKMKEAGYEWDSEKKELKKIEIEVASKESEDEKIRKGLINGFKECLEDCQYPKEAVKYWHNVEVGSILAWLEKQGEKSTIIDIDKMVMEYSQTKDDDFGLPINCMIRAYRKGINDALSIVLNNEKQCENKSAEDTKTIDADKVIEWLKKIIREKAENYGVYKETRLTLPYNSIEDLINDFKEDFGL